MVWNTAQQAAEALRDLVREPHPSKFRKIFTADTIPLLITLLDPPLGADPVRDAAVNLLKAIDREGEAMTESQPAYAEALAGQTRCEIELRRALANSPITPAAELGLTRQHATLQGVQLFRLGVAHKLARVWCHNPIELPDSAVMRRFLADWIDTDEWPVLGWPPIPAVSKWLTDQGYDQIDGAIGLWLTAERNTPILGRDFVR